MSEQLAFTERFFITLRVNEYRRHSVVLLYLFHACELPERVYEQMIPEHFDRTDRDLRSAVEATFSAEEVQALRDWYAMDPAVTIETSPAGQIDHPECVGKGQLPVGSADAWVSFLGSDGFPLPGEIRAYYDLLEAERGPYVSNPELSLLRESFMENGQLVIEHPPF
jgi:hypothetical protein